MKYSVAILLFFASVAAFAGIEKVAVPTDDGIELMWWPKVAPPKGWHFDENSSYHFGFNAIAPDGSTFSEAETVCMPKQITNHVCPQRSRYERSSTRTSRRSKKRRHG